MLVETKVCNRTKQELSHQTLLTYCTTVMPPECLTVQSHSKVLPISQAYSRALFPIYQSSLNVKIFLDVYFALFPYNRERNPPSESQRRLSPCYQEGYYLLTYTKQEVKVFPSSQAQSLHLHPRVRNTIDEATPSYVHCFLKFLLYFSSCG